MKKKSMFVIMMLVVIGVFVGCAALQSNALSDEDIAMKYIEREYEEGNYTIELYEGSDDEFIECIVYDNGTVDSALSLNREYYTNLFKQD